MSEVVPQQDAIQVHANGDGQIVILQVWSETSEEMFVVLQPAHAPALCRAIMRVACGIGPGDEAHSLPLLEAQPDRTGAERQRRYRERQRGLAAAGES